jgi:multidrug efflux pump subunit AcrA (membrane-fusion protein)
MAVDFTDAEDRQSDDAWREIDQLLADVAALAGTATDEHAFYSRALEQTRAAMQARGARAWLRDQAGNWAPLAGVGDSLTHGADDGRRVGQALARREARVVQLSTRGAPRDDDAMLAPVTVDGCLLTAIEVQPRAELSRSLRAGQERFLAAVADCAAEFHRNALLRQLRGREAWWRSFAEFSARIVEATSLARVATEIANGARTLLEVDRAAVVSWSGGRATMQAVSGVDAFDPRAAAVQSAEALTQAVLQIQEPLWYPTDGAVLAPQVEAALARHLDTSPAKSLAVLPLVGSDDAPSAGALLLEQFSGTATDWHDGWPHVAKQSAQALETALVWQALPLGALSQRWALARRRSTAGKLARIGAGVLLGAGLLGMAALIPADFYVAAEGELQPVGMRHVFSSVEGEIVEVLARSGEQVQPGQVLARLRSPKLELESTRVLGELQTAQARLATLEAARLESRFSTAEDAAKAQEMSAEDAELRETVKSLQAQQAVLNEERKLLDVRSPIAGRVVTPWDELDALPARPVRTGQQLFTVVDAAGAWRLELRVPDRWMGHVLAERKEGVPQPVSFVVATDLNTRCMGTVEKIALRANIGDDGEATVLAEANIDASQLKNPRPGATVQAQIACGRRALGYVWFHEICDRVSAWWALHT